MSWTVEDPEHLAAVGQAGAPPSDFESFFSDETWSWIWASWSAEQMGRGDRLPYHLYCFATACLSGATLGELQPLYVGSSAPMAVGFPADLEQRVGELVDSGGGDETALRGELWDRAMERVYDYYGTFWADVQFVQQQAGGQDGPRTGPQRSGFSREMIVESMVDELNHDRLKSMGPGTFQPFWQIGNLVLIGPDHYDAYYDFIQEQDGFCTGYVTMDAKGKAFSTGSITVTGSNDEAGFKEAVRRFSKKHIDFE